jgi:hypothetical protein
MPDAPAARPATTPAQGVARPSTTGAQRATPVDGVAPLAKPDGAKADAPVVSAVAARTLTPPAGAATTGPAVVARTLTPPSGAATTTPAVVPRNRRRPPTEPEIETYLELEADLPEIGGEPDLESELALSFAFSGGFDADHAVGPVAMDPAATRVVETDDGSELTVTVSGGHESRRQHAITGEDASVVSGTIGEDPARRRGRSSRE